MEIFVSWSGQKGRQTAEALRQFLQETFNREVSTWFSKVDIGKGARWFVELAAALERSQFGIVCVTRSSLNSPWLLFEAGAIAKAVQESNVCPFLVDVPAEELSGPLGHFQVTLPTYQEIALLCDCINRRLARPLPRKNLETMVRTAWKRLSSRLRQIRSENRSQPDPRIQEELIRFLSRLKTYEDFSALLRPIRVPRKRKHGGSAKRKYDPDRRK